MVNMFSFIILSFGIIIIYSALVIYMMFQKIKEEKNKSIELKNKQRPNRVMVPDNVKKEPQTMSTQKTDARVYDVEYEKKSLYSKGYTKSEGSNEYVKSESNGIEKDDFITKEKEIDPIDNKNEKYGPLNSDEDDEDPIKDK